MLNILLYLPFPPTVTKKEQNEQQGINKRINIPINISITKTKQRNTKPSRLNKTKTMKYSGELLL